MSSNIVNQAAYLRTSREFPQEMHQLTVEVDRSYVDIANAVNLRTIGLFPTNRPAITGETWFVRNNNRQQTLRQVYTFSSVASSIDHGILINSIDRFTRCWGSFTDGTNWYGLPWATNVAVAGLRTFYITPTQIAFTAGAGAPAFVSGTIVLEWMTNP